MQDTDISNIRMGDSSFIAFPRDEHPLRGIYPPICRISEFVFQTNVREDGQLYEHSRHDTAWLAEQARNHHVALLKSPLKGTSNDIIICVPKEDREIFEKKIELQEVTKEGAFAGVISVQKGNALLYSIV